MPKGLVAEFESAHAMLAALKKLRGDGYRRLDAFSPYPVEGVEELLELPRSPVPAFVLAGGTLGVIVGYGVQWACNAWAYPLNVGGRPLNSAPAWIIITFETMILFAGLTALLSCILLSRLPRLWDPVFEIDGFERASVDRFFVAIGADDRRLDLARTPRELARLGALRQAAVDEEGATMLEDLRAAPEAGS